MGSAPGKLRIAFATPEYVTEDHFDGGLANYLNRTAKLLADRRHDVHVVTLSRKDEREFNHEGVMVHRVMLKPSWHVFNRATRYSLTTTLHWLNFSTQAFRKLKQLHREQPQRRLRRQHLLPPHPRRDGRPGLREHRMELPN